MIGSIIGDIAGSIYEFNNLKTKDFELLSAHGCITDDSILTVATADWLLHGGDSGMYYSDWGNANPFPRGGYGMDFKNWLVRGERSGVRTPYGSCGNGSAMRVGPVGWAFNTADEVLAAARASAECTHNHPEGIKGAQAISLSFLMARQGRDKEEIRSLIEARFSYDLHFTCDSIRDTYDWGATCQDTVPQAIVAFLDGTDFEDSIRNAISIGGDSDTIGCITGSIAEAYYGIPEEIYNKGMGYLPDSFRYIVDEFEDKFGRKVLHKLRQ